MARPFGSGRGLRHTLYQQRLSKNLAQPLRRANRRQPSRSFYRLRPFPAASCRSRRRWANMRAVLPLFALLLSGCALLFTEGETELGIVEAGTSSDAVIRTVLPRDARAIRFYCPMRTPTEVDDVRVTIELTNTSKSGVVSVRTTTGLTEVLPHSKAIIYDGGLLALLDGSSVPISCGSGRVSCELHFRFASRPTQPQPIRVRCSHSSAPL